MIAHLTVDGARCTGHGRCYAAAPRLLEDDEEGFVSVRDTPIEVAAADLDDAYDAQQACPENAISISENPTTGGTP
jgi:ferredoxin